MIKLAGIVGALIGIAISIVFTEVIFPNHYDWTIAFQAVGAALGWLIGTTLVRRHRGRADDRVPLRS